ncbi:MAG: glycosyltransferase, partial [bacterium]
ETLTPALSPEGRGSGLPSSPFRGEDRGEGYFLWVLSPLFIPLPRYEFVRRLNGLICRLSLRFWGWRLGFRDPVLINYVPVLAEAMRGWRRCSPQSSGCQVAELHSEDTVPKQSTTEQLNSPATSPRAPRAVYHCVDRWDQFGMYDSALMAEMDRRCCVYADLVMASSTDLYERCRPLNPNTVMMAHGVDWEHFREAVSGKREEGSGKSAPVVGFFGLLSEWVDQDLILRLAKEFPQATILLIGKADVEVTRLQGVPNIQLAGPKPFAELPSHIARFTMGIIPFVVNDLTRAVNPIKLREMLAAGCPVVSTALPEVEKYAGIESGVRSAVCVAHDADEFLAGVRACLEHPLSIEERRAVSDSMAGEAWAGKVDAILRWVG